MHPPHMQLPASPYASNHSMHRATHVWMHALRVAQVLLADKYIEQLLPAKLVGDNYLVYAVGSAVRSRAALSLIMTHNRCMNGTVPCGQGRACHP